MLQRQRGRGRGRSRTAGGRRQLRRRGLRRHSGVAGGRRRRRPCHRLGRRHAGRKRRRRGLLELRPRGGQGHRVERPCYAPNAAAAACRHGLRGGAAPVVGGRGTDCIRSVGAVVIRHSFDQSHKHSYRRTGRKRSAGEGALPEGGGGGGGGACGRPELPAGWSMSGRVLAMCRSRPLLWNPPAAQNATRYHPCLILCVV